MIDNLYLLPDRRMSSVTCARRLPIVLTAMVVLQLPATVSGQTNTFPASGNVGIGTTSPSTLLEVTANPSGTAPQVRISPIGNTGSSTSLPSFLDFLSTFDDYPADQYPRRTATIKARFAGGVWGYETLIFEVGSGGASDDSGNELIERMRIAGNGNVGIGTTAPVHLLQVAGTVGAEEVIVSSTGADYVFQPDYRLRPLSEVATFIEQNHHLPDLSSAAEVKQKGLNLGEMQTKLLAKIEELTLHMIEADEHSRHLEQQNRELQDRIARLEAAGEGSRNRQK